MKRIEVLLVKSASGKKFLNAFLHDPVSGIVLHEDVDTFMFRSLLPHNERLEVRYVSIEDDEFQEPLWYLRTIPVDNTREFGTYTSAFQELFEVAEGFYSPKMPRPFTATERREDGD